MYYGIFKSRGKADERPPSKRYMNLLVRGAMASNLKPEYIAELEKVPTYSPPEHILKLRLTRPGSKSSYFGKNSSGTCILYLQIPLP